MRDTPCGSQIFPLIITQANCFLHSPSLQERGWGVRLFFNPINAPHIACKASAHDVRSVSTIIKNGRKGYFLQTIRSRMIVKQSQYVSPPNLLSYREEEYWKQFAYK